MYSWSICFFRRVIQSACLSFSFFDFICQHISMFVLVISVWFHICYQSFTLNGCWLCLCNPSATFAFRHSVVGMCLCFFSVCTPWHSTFVVHHRKPFTFRTGCEFVAVTLTYSDDLFLVTVFSGLVDVWFIVLINFLMVCLFAFGYG